MSWFSELASAALRRSRGFLGLGEAVERDATTAARDFAEEGRTVRPGQRVEPTFSEPTPPRNPAIPTADEIRARNQARIDADDALRRFNERMEARARGETPPRGPTEPPRGPTEPPHGPTQPPLWNPNQSLVANIANVAVSFVPRVWRSGIAGKAALIGGGVLAAPHWLGTHIGAFMATFHNVPGLGPLLQSISNYFPAVAEGYATTLNTSAVAAAANEPFSARIDEMVARTRALNTGTIVPPQATTIDPNAARNVYVGALRTQGNTGTGQQLPGAVDLNSLNPYGRNDTRTTPVPHGP